MSVHSCCCIIFCIAWFEVGFRIELRFHFELALKKKYKREKNEFFLLPLFLACSISFPRGPFPFPGRCSLSARAKAQRLFSSAPAQAGFSFAHRAAQRCKPPAQFRWPAARPLPQTHASLSSPLTSRARWTCSFFLSPWPSRTPSAPSFESGAATTHGAVTLRYLSSINSRPRCLPHLICCSVLRPASYSRLT